jgi:hypothetical protein
MIVPQAAPSRRETHLQCLGPGGRQRAWRKQGDLPSLEEPLRQDESWRDEAPRGARKGQCPAEEAGGRSNPVHSDPKEGERDFTHTIRVGPNLSPKPSREVSEVRILYTKELESIVTLS